MGEAADDRRGLARKHVFISYAAEDKDTADAIRVWLNEFGMPTWMAPYDISVGETYPTSITRAIKVSSLMIIVYSKHTNASEHVLSEANQAMKHGIKRGLFALDTSEPSEALEYLVGTRHWILNPDSSFDDKLEVLRRSISAPSDDAHVGEVSGNT